MGGHMSTDSRARAGQGRSCLRRLGISLGLAGLALGPVALATPALAAGTFTVTNTADSGAGSLRQAMSGAIGAGGGDVTFAIPTTEAGFAGGVFTIAPSSALPTIRNGVKIDGTTQTAATGDTNPAGPVVLNGSLIPSASGLFISGDGNTIQGLVVNGFTTGAAISVSYAGGDFTPSGNAIQDNFFGTDAAGRAPVPNRAGIGIGGYGSPFAQAADNIVRRNLIAASYYGVVLCDTVRTDISANTIGLAGAGLGNSGQGILLTCAGVVATTISANTITNSGAEAISDFPDYRYSDGRLHDANRITRNAIFANGALGVDLNPAPFGTLDGVTPNDPGDGDAGGNGLQNYPVLTAATATGAGIEVRGTLNSQANTVFSVEVFGNEIADPSGYGEGQRYLATVAVTTGADGNGAFAAIVPAAAAGAFVTSTATDPAGNTSEFSAALATPPLGQAPAITSPATATFSASSAGTFTVTAIGLPAPTLSMTGALPAGVTFNPATGVLASTPGPASEGKYPLVFTAANGVSPDATQKFTLTVVQHHLHGGHRQ